MQVHEPMGLFEVSRMGKLIEVDFSQPRKRSTELAFSKQQVLRPDFNASMREVAGEFWCSSRSCLSLLPSRVRRGGCAGAVQIATGNCLALPSWLASL